METYTEIRVSRRAIVIAAFAVIGIIAALAIRVGGRPATAVTTAAASAAAPLRTASADGVDVVVEDVRSEDGETVVVLALNNHQYDLSDPAIADRSSLAGVRPSAFVVQSSAMGGHHVSAEMRFDGVSSGPLVIGVAEGVSLTLDI